MIRPHDKLRVTEVAEMLGYTRKTIQRWSDRGLLRAMSRGAFGHRRFLRQEVERFREKFLGEAGGTMVRCPHCGRPVVSFAVRDSKEEGLARDRALAGKEKQRARMKNGKRSLKQFPNLLRGKGHSASQDAPAGRIKRNHPLPRVDKKRRTAAQLKHYRGKLKG